MKRRGKKKIEEKRRPEESLSPDGKDEALPDHRPTSFLDHRMRFQDGAN